MSTAQTAQRTYQRTHPWLDFRVDFRPANPELWMLLGEAKSKIEHVARTLLNPDVAQEMHIVYLAKGVLATTAIEGNTLSEAEARLRIEGQLELPPSQEYLGREIDNIIAGYNEIKDELVYGSAPPLTRQVIVHYNRLVLAGLELEDGVVPGEVPQRNVGVGNYLGAPREDCEFLLDRLCSWLNTDFQPREPDWILPMALIKAVVAHLYLAWIHPFGDGNGRTARLMELRILLEAGVPTPAAHLLSNHYNQTRLEYYRQLQRASNAAGGGALPFVQYALQGFVDGLRDQLARIREQQFGDRWEQHIYQEFGRTNSRSKLRQRQLVLEMSQQDDPLQKGELRHLSGELVEMYGGKTDKTLTRDINALIGMGLIRREGRLYFPNKGLIEAFHPVSAEPEPHSAS
ncbi:MAG: Fic family protein [Actinomycetota bacterium]